MIIFQSFWSRPALQTSKEDFKSQLFLAALSSIYASQVGYNIRLHTDSFGQRALSQYPYLEILTDLDEIPQENPVMCMRAQSKFYALKNEELGNIHIDTDILLKKPVFDGLWPNKKYDIICQFLEKDIYPNDGYYEAIHKKMKLVVPYSFIQKIDNYTNAINCGTIGFNNQNLKDQYLKMYFEALDILKNFDLPDPNYWFDLILEQQYLYQIAKNYNILEVIPKNRNCSILDYCNKIGYCHLLGGRKTNKDVRNKIIEQLKAYDLKKFKHLDVEAEIIWQKYGKK